MEGQLADPRVAEQRFAEVNSVAELQNLDSGLEKIRLQITEVADMGYVCSLIQTGWPYAV